VFSLPSSSFNIRAIDFIKPWAPFPDNHNPIPLCVGNGNHHEPREHGIVNGDYVEQQRGEMLE
jgi:hypothetical protein